MRIAVVGVKRSYKEMDPDYVRMFNKYHLEIPFYFAEFGGNDVVSTTIDYTNAHEEFISGGRFRNITEDDYLNRRDGDYDVVIHWRSYFPELYREEAINIMHTCDHSYPESWKESVAIAAAFGYLQGILCHQTWHKRQVESELGSLVDVSLFLAGLTFGVDVDAYVPSPNKDPRALLWSSDPGRGVEGAIQVALRLYQKDRRYRLHICQPDYAKQKVNLSHPAIVVHNFVPNGPKLWNLFGETGVLPYTSTFREPSSRVFRQSQAAGSLVLYPKNMGSPSEIIKDGIDGFVRSTDEWEKLIVQTVEDEKNYFKMTSAARATAVSEDWRVLSQRFNSYFGKILEEKNGH